MVELTYQRTRPAITGPREELWQVTQTWQSTSLGRRRWLTRARHLRASFVLDPGPKLVPWASVRPLLSHIHEGRMWPCRSSVSLKADARGAAAEAVWVIAQSHRSLGGLCLSYPSQAPYLAGRGVPKTLFLDLKGKKRHITKPQQTRPYSPYTSSECCPM